MDTFERSRGRKRKGGMGSPGLGKTIRRLRIEKRISQEKLAEMLRLSFQQIQKYEYGRSRITIDRASEIAKVLEVPLLNLLGYELPLPRDENRIYEKGLTSQELQMLKAFRVIKQKPLQKAVLVILKDLALGTKAEM